MAVFGSSSGTLWRQLLPRHLVQRREHVTATDAYASIKASLLTFTKSLSRMGAPKGVRANNISPGMVYVDDGFFGNRKRENPAEYEQMLAFNPGGRMGRPMICSGSSLPVQPACILYQRQLLTSCRTGFEVRRPACILYLNR